MSINNNNKLCPPRVPKKDARKKEWVDFFKIFPHALKIAPYTKTLNKLGLK